MTTPSPGASGPTRTPRPVPERFLVSRRTLHLDRLMTSLIGFGGVCIVMAVFAIFAFILAEVLPLFGSARLVPGPEVTLPAEESALSRVGLDEWSRLPFRYDGERTVRFQPADGVGPGTETVLPLADGVAVTSSRFDAVSNRLVLGQGDGQVALVRVRYAAESAGTAITGQAEMERVVPVLAGQPVVQADYKDAGDRKLVAALAGGGLHVVPLRQSRSLLGAGQVKPGERVDLTAELGAEKPVRVLVPGTADGLVVQTESGELVYFFQRGTAWEVRQRFRPFSGDEGNLVGLEFLFGDVSLVTWNDSGDVRVFSLYVKEGEQLRTFGMTKEFPRLEGGVRHYLASQRDKSFVVAGDRELALCYATTQQVRLRRRLPFVIQDLAMDAKGEHLAVADADGTLHLFEVHDPHPEAGWRAFFGQVWYEGASEPKHEWQSTSGTDDFEPKLSLTPLIIGSLKGTIYALVFAVPIALLAAVFVSQFLAPDAKKVIKPVMEIMASLPSVVLGFLAALWLAPLIEARVPSVILVILFIPLAAAGIGFGWSLLPISLRNRLPKGGEFVVLIPVVLAVGALGWQLGPVLERLCFTVTMDDGSRIADFRLWWPQFTGTPFDQRNCLVVGFMMGFAVIPIIFTISEDALSNVPSSIISASEALGASRWQVVRSVVLPVASAGIFSALMIGFGRAVGETMIVVMATGNTAIMDPSGSLLFGEAGIGDGKFPIADHWNPFNGMRTLSANIAVELPEAAVHSTHYRSLFLGALVLFLMTFSLNTVAELLRQRLREQFRIG